MIHVNTLQEDVQPHITRMPCAEFGGGRIGEVGGHLYEIQFSDHLTLVLDEQSAILLCEALLDAIPEQNDVGGSYSLGVEDEDDDKGEEWKGEAKA